MPRTRSQTPTIAPAAAEEAPEEKVKEKDKPVVLASETNVGLPVSGKWWKMKVNSTSGSKLRRPARSRVAVKTMHTSWATKEKERRKKILVRAKEDELKEEKAEKLRILRERREQRKKASKEKSLKSESVQVITNPQKLKKMSAKQRKLLRKAAIEL